MFGNKKVFEALQKKTNAQSKIPQVSEVGQKKKSTNRHVLSSIKLAGALKEQDKTKLVFESVG